ncbi:aminotransferase class I/II-fold pyridoxal phosphate-dependent enzyme [Streptomyces sp. NPDC057620]|uniref:Aminotransferase class I/II-fold pyridoxal phosphate-dependent enzyme n=1 Tax=Streptomyces liliiviolaceus TaxID=2823109 RepID=A0A940XX24_9ACTN|nr:aminotransferase class I/II-fold pyridoxal phosphate-dependent enzyme [Streptomyces liliiviolaceus]MBQ0852347.1 aminotransferase class I/II-fold pyridoxal phosphate-dependent enzyme [Streptomyces liliiviolaceus]
MRRTEPEGHGPVRYGPPLPGHGLPPPPGLVAAATGTHTEPTGGGAALLDAARGYWTRRGLPTDHDRTVAAPGAPALLLALTAALGGDVLVPRPCAAWWTPQARLLGASVFPVGTPAECGGVPDPYALLETVRRVRAEGGDPRLLVLSVADDPAATVAPPELVHETIEAAVGEGLHIVSDETWRDTLHEPQDSVLIGPAEMLPDRVTVLADLGGPFLPAGWPAAIARFPGNDTGTLLRDRVLDVLTALDARIAAPVASAAAYALGEPDEITRRLAVSVRLHASVAAAAHRALTAAGALVRPPRAGRHLYADLGPLRSALGALGVGDAQELEDFLSVRLDMPAPGGHRFGDDLGALRVRLSTGPFLGTTDDERMASLVSPEPLELPHVKSRLSLLGSTFGDLRDDDDARRRESPR